MIIYKYIESLELAYGSKGKKPGRNNKTDLVTIKQCGCYLGRLYSHYQAEKKYYSKLLNPSES